jgi:hypothetical protein
VVPNYSVLDIEKIGYSEVYFRIVRPNNNNDIATLHTDGSFYEITNGISKKIWSKWIKIWIPIEFEPSKNDIGFFSNSMSSDLIFGIRTDRDKIRPVLLNNDFNIINAEFFGKQVGNIIYFSPKILHGAINNRANYTRVSIEFAIGPA